ncbi:MAG: division/cell wall cluster transcriptional repressor MraZ [Bacteroidota bacterium]|nr:division/cell wall cluster transcriptional repressor MraZ [Bacteroidota bacterium]
MAFFSGEYGSKIDAKGRMVLPARLKNSLPLPDNKHVIITKGFETCLVIYPMNEWNILLTRLSVLSEFNEEQRNLQRNLMARSAEVEIDNLGRLLLPKTMKEYASLESDVTVLGVGSKIEVWNPAVYEKIQIKDSAQLSKLAEKYLTNSTQ